VVREVAIGSNRYPLPMIWFGQSVRTTLVLPDYPALADAPVMASLGDAIHRPRLLETVFSGRLRERLKARGPLLLDSGGFTALRNQRQALPLRELADVYAKADADLVVSLDVPPTLHCKVRERQRRYETTLANLVALTEAFEKERIVPVVHGRLIREISENARAIRQVLPSPTMICLGGLVPLLRRSGRAKASRHIRFIAQAVREVRQLYPDRPIHLLGAGSPRTVIAALALGADSVDSMAWRRAAGFGTVFLPGQGERFVDARPRRRATSRPLLTREDIMNCDCPVCSGKSFGRRLSSLSRGYRKRAAHNAWVLSSEVAAFVAAKAEGCLDRHLASRLPAAWLQAWRDALNESTS
jgi:tRNA-guanine family transglycosylase